ncbi:MAG: sugar diacid recognition domain-containing protein [Termitinemataceae bacterium]
MEPGILSAETAQAFVERLGHYIPQNINIINQAGIIIASRDQDRIGTYHEAAHRLIIAQKDIEELEPDRELPPGVKPGVNLPLVWRGTNIGVVGITGAPKDVKSLAYAVKISLETFMELEYTREQLLQKQAGLSRFISRLLNSDYTDKTSLHEVARRTGYDPGLPRTPIILKTRYLDSPEECIRLLRERRLLTRQDIITPTIDGDLLIFKTQDSTKAYTLATWEQELRSLYTALRDQIPDVQVLCGMMQGDISRYHACYRQLLWLDQQLDQGLHNQRRNSGKALCFFHDYLLEYLVERKVHTSLRSAPAGIQGVHEPDLLLIFEYPLQMLKTRNGGKIPSWISETLAALAASDFSIQEAAQTLGLHRNSLSNRVEKIEQLFGIDPVKQISWRNYFRILVYYL